MAGTKLPPKTYVERHAESIREGEAPQPEIKVDKLDTPEHQEAVLNPETFELTLPVFNKDDEQIADEVVTVRTKLTPKDVFGQRRTANALEAFTNTIIQRGIKLSGDSDAMREGWFADNLSFFQTAGLLESAQELMCECLALLTKKPARAFATMDAMNIKIATTWLLTIFLREVKGLGNSGDSQPKKDEAGNKPQ